MLNYNDVYETLRKEKYSEILQPLPKEFLKEIAEYLSDRKEQSTKNEDMFNEDVMKNKKQLENSIALFKEIILRRKKKLLNLVFVATETGIMKRDYENMMSFEKEMFDNLVRAFEEGDKMLTKIMQGRNEKDKDENVMIIFNQNVDKFVDMSGGTIGPFASGELANLDRVVSEILIADGKARKVDE